MKSYIDLYIVNHLTERKARVLQTMARKQLKIIMYRAYFISFL